MIKKTSLFNLHKKHNAKLVEFAGYEMPIHYKDGIIQEHKFTRSNCGIFDVSHMGQLFIYGKENLTKDLENILDLRASLLSAEATLLSTINKKESRGIHKRKDFLKISDKYN